MGTQADISAAFAEKVVWITGASSGIGEGMAKAFAGAGAKVVLCGRNVDELNRVRDECVAAGAQEDYLMVLLLDVLDYDAMPAALQAVLDEFSRVDILINNACLLYTSPSPRDGLLSRMPSSA